MRAAVVAIFAFALAACSGGGGSVTPSQPQGASSAAALQGAPSMAPDHTVSGKTIASIQIGPVATGATAGTPGTYNVPVKAFDSSNTLVSGSYANPITLDTDDTSNGALLTIAGSGVTSTSVTLNNSSAVVNIRYTGLAMTPRTLTATATGVPNATATFTPTLKPIVANVSSVYLAHPGGAGSNTITLSERGWTNYSKTLTADASACTSIGTLDASSGTSFSATAVASPSAGTCNLSFSDGLGQQKNVTLAYTTTTFTVNLPYVSPNAVSIRVNLNQLNGSTTIPAWIGTNPATTPTSTGAAGNCTLSSVETCTLGAVAPPGNMVYTVATLDGSGNILQRLTKQVTNAAGTANTSQFQLHGVAKKVTIGGPSLHADTPLNASPLTVAAYDASGTPITGSATFLNPVTISDSDATATSLTVNGGAAASSIVMTSPGDNVAISYSGLALGPEPVLKPRGDDGIWGTAKLGRTNQPIIMTNLQTCNCASDVNNGKPTLFFDGVGTCGATNNSPCTRSTEASELGWSNAPYNKAFAATLDPATCGSGASAVATVSTFNSAKFVVTAKNPGICKMTVSDGIGRSREIWLSVTTASGTVN